MPQQQNQVRRKLNVRAFVTVIILFLATMLAGILAGWISSDPEGILAGLAFVAFLIFIGWWIEWSGLGKYFGG